MVAFYIVLDNDDPGFEVFVNGKALARKAEKLDDLASDLVVRQLSGFFSQNPNELRDFMEDLGAEVDQNEIPGEEWFSAAEGLETVHALLAHYEHSAERLGEDDALVQDLREFERVLTEAAQNGIRWHLAVDF